MAEYDEALAALKRIEHNQQRSLELQAEQLAILKAQVQRTEARIEESIGLQRVANSRQAKALNFVLPVIVVAMAVVGYLLFRHG